MKKVIALRFQVELSREPSVDEMSALHSALLAQCEGFVMGDYDDEVELGYTIGTDHSSVSEELQSIR